MTFYVFHASDRQGSPRSQANFRPTPATKRSGAFAERQIDDREAVIREGSIQAEYTRHFHVLLLEQMDAMELML